MSAAYGRILDRHIKLFRFKSHPVVTSGEILKEPLLHLVTQKSGGKSSAAKKRQEKARQRQKQQKKKKSSSTSGTTEKKSFFSDLTQNVCPECQGDVITFDGPRNKRCNVCFHEWV